MIDRLVSIHAADGEVLAAARRAMASDDRWACRSLAAVRRWFEERLLLATCERCELFGVLRPGRELPRIPDGVAMRRGQEAAQHLLRVAAGLESRIVGESHVLGQVAAAGRVAAAAETDGAILRGLLAAAIRTGRRVRTETPLGCLAGSAVRAAVERLERWCPAEAARVGHVAPGTRHGAHAHGRVAVAGVLGGGAMALEVADALRSSPQGSGWGRPRWRVILFARHVERARLAAGDRPIEIVDIKRITEQVGMLDAVVAATSSARTLIGAEDLRQLRRPLLIVDLGVPANVEASVAALEGVQLVSLAELSGPDHAREVLDAAERIVDEELLRWTRRAAPGRRRVILAAHGAGEESEANRVVRKLARAIAARRDDCSVEVGFNIGSPRLDRLGWEPARHAAAPQRQARFEGVHIADDHVEGAHVADVHVAGAQSSGVHIEPPAFPTLPERGGRAGRAEATVVPVMTGAGWFLCERLPALLAASPAGAMTEFRCTPPVGSVRRLRRGVLRDVQDALRSDVASGAAEALAIIVVGHGTARHSASGDATREVAEEIELLAQRESPRRCIDVIAAFLDESPRLEEVAARSAAGAHLLVPWLIGGGGHERRDLRERLQRWAEHPRTRILRPLGERPELLESSLDLLAWHAPDRPLRVGTRRSALALRQAELAEAALRGSGMCPRPAALRRVIIDTAGDRDLARPIEEFTTDGPFSDELEQALADGRIDVAVHSLKDLPLSMGRETCIAAILPRGERGEALVTADGRGLAELAPGARVGTCSARRRAQLAMARPDLLAVTMRGPVDERVSAVDRGQFDAAILAIAGLERLGLSPRIAERLSPQVMLAEAGQGAIALTVRVDDLPARRVCAEADDRCTRHAVEVERRVALAIEVGAGFAAIDAGGGRPGLPMTNKRAGEASNEVADALMGGERSSGSIAAVEAEFRGEGILRVRARAIDRRSGAVRDAACDVGAGEDAIAVVLERLGLRESPMTGTARERRDATERQEPRRLLVAEAADPAEVPA
jgi:hydroxymethylbilane synthase